MTQNSSNVMVEEAPVENESSTSQNYIREVHANRILNTHTACDACSARSTNVVFPDGQTEPVLSFCGHHTRKNAEALLKSGYSIFPEGYGF